VIACIHLKALPGAPGYSGNVNEVIETALEEAEIFNTHKINGLIIENFRDMPFYPDRLPAETIAAMAVIANEVGKVFKGPVGVNALRNDAQAALAIAVASGARFIRVNVHSGASLTDQGIIEGKAHETLRLRSKLNSDTLIFADVAVKHASSLGNRSIEEETRDCDERGLADAIIVSGQITGSAVEKEKFKRVQKSTSLPVLIGSGVNPENLHEYFDLADGFIVGSTFKTDGKAKNFVDRKNVEQFMDRFRSLQKNQA
jgi:membrane complex biogenesis BtpA family protein